MTANHRGYDADEPEDPEFTPMTAEQARVWRLRNPVLYPWQVVGLQVVTAIILGLTAWGASGRVMVGYSVLYGAAAITIPAAMFARGLMRQPASVSAAAISLRFFVWEAVKLMASVAMIAAAPRVVKDLSWLALVAGLVVTMKVYWVALLWRPVRKTELKV